ncbi:unnamed protein product [Diamesa serratosioi]
MSSVQQRKNVSKKTTSVASPPQTSKTDKSAKYKTKPVTIPNQKAFTRVIFTTGIFIVVYFTAARDKSTNLALFKETLPLRELKVECSGRSFSSEELEKYPQCIPAFCGRFVTDSLVSESEQNHLLNLAKTVIDNYSDERSAAIFDLTSGALSKGENFINIYKVKEAQHIQKLEGFTAYKLVKAKILHAISQQFRIDPQTLYLTQPTFFSKMTNITAKSVHDEYWHEHVDKDTYESFHYTSLVYLTNFSKDFTGGRFIFIDTDDKGNNKTVVVEPKAGRVLGFTSGYENIHFVEKVTSGIRYALTVSFTCDRNLAIDF